MFSEIVMVHIRIRASADYLSHRWFRLIEGRKLLSTALERKAAVPYDTRSFMQTEDLEKKLVGRFKNAYEHGLTMKTSSNV